MIHHRGYEATCRVCQCTVTVDAENLCEAEDNLLAAGWAIWELETYCPECKPVEAHK